MMYIIFLILFILGLILGSYLNSWMWRVHEHKWKFGGRSECVHCGRQLAWWENVPLVSFILLRGKCHTCKKAIPADYFLVELATGILFVVIGAISFGPQVFFRNLFFTALLIVVFVYDYKYQIILSGVVWSGTILALISNFQFPISNISQIYSPLFGIIIGGGFFLLQYVVSKGRWIGGGDVRFGVMMGALLSWPNILVALFIAYVLGALVSVPLLIAKKIGPKSAIPFGTFLALGTFVVMMWGTNIVNWYFGLIGM